MRALLRGTLYCALWYGSIVAGFLFIACPLLPVLLLSPIRFRKCADLLFSCWELYPTGLLEMFGVKILVSGDHISPYESAILVMNHRTRVDWNFLWAAMYQACMPEVAAHKLKFILKDPIRHIPGPGWVMQINGFLYITRHWDEDRGRLSGSLDYLVALGRRCQLLIFPEGTDLTPDSKKKSNNYASKHGLPKYDYTLHPKTTGFSYLVRHLHQAEYLDAVYDLTIAYPDYVPQSEVDLVRGKLPKEVHFHVERIPATDVPKDDSMLRQWLENRWHHKEASLEQFSKRKSFPAKIWPMASLIPLRAAIGFWSLLTGAAILLLIISPLFQLWALVHAVVFICLSLFSNGFNQIEMGWYWRWRSHG
ncbi:lysocardiolipin acyltransferase 1-like [Athalia rosae]|uniref:lysocardiolipin acyltransferase 1-like n=1 Tax=Athalia rosae TaxID=37344 RepID=UPI00203342B0|nr:lysocardiolipin acyltransferase 1-like [Athalia rosae]XP_020711254.2 lysocardiolipin acyltransferase 1-like [Athalia rosae]XP_048507918.1 lysocardiolipin acyltransferase 1-like [Athalia rosae]XP_048507988.1 lysocardiolipin acyltransferase 1-like [Athalia rosae]XP_048508047.1 lysocardiolipin acyltransferase 1-like [Athalia rosae]